MSLHAIVALLCSPEGTGHSPGQDVAETKKEKAHDKQAIAPANESGATEAPKGIALR